MSGYDDGGSGGGYPFMPFVPSIIDIFKKLNQNKNLTPNKILRSSLSPGFSMTSLFSDYENNRKLSYISVLIPKSFMVMITIFSSSNSKKITTYLN